MIGGNTYTTNMVTNTRARNGKQPLKIVHSSTYGGAIPFRY
jgi:hypothetical protein